MATSSPLFSAGSWRGPGLASLAGVARRVATLFTESEGTGGAKNNGEHRLGGGRQGQEVASQCWRWSLRCPACLVSLGLGNSIACPAGRNLGNLTYCLPRRGLICGASTGRDSAWLVTLLVVLSQEKLGAPCFCQLGAALEWFSQGGG